MRGSGSYPESGSPPGGGFGGRVGPGGVPLSSSSAERLATTPQSTGWKKHGRCRTDGKELSRGPGARAASSKKKPYKPPASLDYSCLYRNALRFVNTVLHRPGIVPQVAVPRAVDVPVRLPQPTDALGHDAEGDGDRRVLGGQAVQPHAPVL